MDHPVPKGFRQLRFHCIESSISSIAIAITVLYAANYA